MPWQPTMPGQLMHLGMSRLRGRHHKQMRAQTNSRSTDQRYEGGNVSIAALQQETISSDRRQIYVIGSPVHLVWLSRAFVEQHSPRVTSARSTAVRMTSGVKEGRQFASGRCEHKRSCGANTL